MIKLNNSNIVAYRIRTLFLLNDSNVNYYYYCYHLCYMYVFQFLLYCGPSLWLIKVYKWKKNNDNVVLLHLWM